MALPINPALVILALADHAAGLVVLDRSQAIDAASDGYHEVLAQNDLAPGLPLVPQHNVHGYVHWKVLVLVL